MIERVQITPEDAAAAKEAPKEPQAPAENTPAPAERPAWLPEKFASAEDLSKAYQELEKRLGSVPKVDDEAAPNADTEGASDADAVKVAQEAGLDYDGLVAKFSASGAIDDGDYAAIEKLGIPRHVVDQHLAGLRASADAVRQDVFASIGGEDKYAETINWAQASLSEAEKVAFNKAVEGGDIAVAKLAVAGLRSKFEAANGKEPALINGDTSAASSDSFRDAEEVKAAMRDPRYRKSEAFRQEVAAKLSRSDVF